MRQEYDFSKSRKSPYARLFKKSVTIRLDAKTVTYFKKLSSDTGIPYQTLINLYLRDCVSEGRKPDLKWKPAA